MLPSVAALATYGGPLKNYSATVDSSTDRPDAGANPAYADVAAMTHCAPRAIVRFRPVGSGTPILVSWDAVWNNGNNAAPVVSRAGAGSYLITFPATVLDEIPSGSPGSTPGGIALNLRMALPGVEPLAGVMYQVGTLVQPTTPANAVAVAIATVGTSTPADPSDATTFSVVIF
jgi:hypothetical protein